MFEDVRVGFEFVADVAEELGCEAALVGDEDDVAGAAFADAPEGEGERGAGAFGVATGGDAGDEALGGGEVGHQLGVEVGRRVGEVGGEEGLRPAEQLGECGVGGGEWRDGRDGGGWGDGGERGEIGEGVEHARLSLTGRDVRLHGAWRRFGRAGRGSWR
ncbi:MAG: hypothetical protein IPM64_00890 [Phycisphaerales bacterium]|nr:hypothetical protein [Phycisphaerales bacterium]